MDFLFHNISEKEKEEIKEQINSILNSFSEKLSEIKRDIKESSIEREKFEREENGKPQELDKEIMLENAPEKNGDFIIGEKKSWK